MPSSSASVSNIWTAIVFIIVSLNICVRTVASDSNTAGSREGRGLKDSEFFAVDMIKEKQQLQVDALAPQENHDAGTDNTGSSTLNLVKKPGSLRNKLHSRPTDDSNEQLLESSSFSFSEDLTWPWNKKNKTSDNSCMAFKNCTSCTESSMACHWCSKDDQCHAKGSWYGCAIGATCPSNDTVDNSCQSHKSCTECALSSSLCHWCAFDDECHAIGSMYGCSHGVNCYSNDRCKREKPEKIQEGIFQDVGYLPLFLIITSSIGALCCSSMLYAGTSALKGAYDDFARGNAENMTVNVPPIEAFSNHNIQEQLSPIHEETSEDPDAEVDGDGNGDGDNEVDNDCESRDEHAHEENNNDGAEEEQPTENEEQLTQRMLPVTAHPHPSRIPNRIRNENSHMKCLMRSCTIWYTFTIIGVIMFAAAAVLLFPKAPEYNVCSDELAWKSIIAGLTSLKMEASFEMLISVKNENRLDVALENFGGKFKHDGDDIGTFSLDTTIVEATSITDMLVTCTVVPDKWEALGLISDYYKGQLELLVDVSGSVKIKGIGFSIPIKIDDVLVKVNDPNLDDRHLCHCPQWKDLYPTASPVLSFEEAVRDPVELKIPSVQEGQIDLATS